MILKTHREEQTLFWTIDDPAHKNAIGTRLADALDKALTDLNGDQQTRVLVIGASPSPATAARPVWIAGGNLKELALLKAKESARAYAAKMSGIVAGLQNLHIPVLMAIHGDAIGGGAEFALGGDLRFMTAASHFDFKQLQIGLATGYGTCQRLVSLIGLSRATQALLLAQRVSAETALAWGLVHRVCPGPTELAQEVRRAAKQLVALEPRAVACQKKMLAQAHTAAADARSNELAWFTDLWMNPTHAQFLERFLDGNR